MASKESELEQGLIKKLVDLKYIDRKDIRDRAALEQNFRQHFEALMFHARPDEATLPRAGGILAL